MSRNFEIRVGKKIPVELKKKKNGRAEKERTLTSCVVNRSSLKYCRFFFSLGRLIEDLERQLSSALYDSSEFLSWRRDEYKR